MVIDVILAMPRKPHLHNSSYVFILLCILFIGVVRAYSGLKTGVCALKFSIKFNTLLGGIGPVIRPPGRRPGWRRVLSLVSSGKGEGYHSDH